jgi:hypothetical protein
MRSKQISSEDMLDLYADYLICSFSQTTSTGLASLLENSISHDQITRFLSEKKLNNKDLWRLVKPFMRKIEKKDACFIVDDTILEKPYTKENDIIAWHFDHTVGRSVKGVNIINCTYTTGTQTLPLGFEIISKTQKFTDKKTGKEKRRATKTKNELFLSMLNQAIQNQVKFEYVLGDIWFSSISNMRHIHSKKKTFIMPLKSNRLVAMSKKEKFKGNFQAVSSLELKQNSVQEVFIKGLEIPVLLTKQVFTNKDGSNGILYLVTNKLTLDYTDFTSIYQKRWKVEEFHKSIKSNTGLASSPTKTVRTQSNHFFASIYANIKLECLSWKQKKNHFALKMELYLKAIQSSMKQLRTMS